jgi:anti-sigma B factor antagonist
MIYTVIKDIAGIRVVQVLVEDIMFDNYEAVFDKIRQAVNDDDNMILLDMARVRFMDSISLGMLVPLQLYARRMQGAMAVMNLQPAIADMFKVLSLDKIIRVYDNVDEAARDMPQSAGGGT